MSFLFFGNNQKTISDLFSSSAAKIVIRASGKNAFSVAADAIARNLEKTVDNYLYMTQAQEEDESSIPTNITLSLVGYKDNCLNFSLENANILFGVAISLDYLYARGRKKINADEVAGTVLQPLIDDKVIPVPSFEILSDTITLVWQMERPWKLPERKKEKKELLAQIAEWTDLLVKSINHINPSANAKAVSLSKGIFLPETRRKKMERTVGKEKKYQVIADVIVKSKSEPQARRYTLFQLLHFRPMQLEEASEEEKNLIAQMERMESVLHHDRRGGAVLVASFDNDSGSPTWLTFTATVKRKIVHSLSDTYLSLPLQKGNGVTTASAWSLPGIYIDLDIINKTATKDEEKTKIIDQALAALHQAIEEEILPKPTLVCRTGGGLAVFYILERSIPLYEGAETGKTVAYMKAIWEFLMDKISHCIAGLAMEVDPSSLKEGHLVRLAGSWNPEAQRYCLIDESFGDPVYYHLRQLQEYGFRAWKEQQKNNTMREYLHKNVKAQRLKFKLSRAEAWVQILEAKLESEIGLDGKTEVILHLLANMMAYFIDFETMYGRLKAINNKLSCPLSGSRLYSQVYLGIVRFVEKNGSPYKYSDQRLMSLSGVTMEDLRPYVRCSAKTSRNQTHEKWEQWKAMAESHEKGSQEYMTLKELADYFGVHTNTLAHAFKKMGYIRNEAEHEETAKRTSQEIREEWSRWVQFAKMHEKGSKDYYSIARIAEEFGVHVNTLKNALKEMGYSRRRGKAEPEIKKVQKVQNQQYDTYKVVGSYIRSQLRVATRSMLINALMRQFYEGKHRRLHSK